jgi:hypothetical protein
VFIEIPFGSLSCTTILPDMSINAQVKSAGQGRFLMLFRASTILVGLVVLGSLLAAHPTGESAPTGAPVGCLTRLGAADRVAARPGQVSPVGVLCCAAP